VQYTADSDKNAPFSCTFSSPDVHVCLLETVSKIGEKRREDRRQMKLQIADFRMQIGIA
jgi:hypothetical protein